MIAALWSFVTARLAGPLALAAALLLGLGLAWQSVRIDGWPFFGGGLKAQLAGLQQQLAAGEMKSAQATAAAWAARLRHADAAAALAADAARRDAETGSQIRNVIEKVPVYVSSQADRECIVPWGAVRLLDAAASGADPGDASAAIAPGRPDDAASDVTLSEAVALLAADLGTARRNAGQLKSLEDAVRAQGP